MSKNKPKPNGRQITLSIEVNEDGDVTIRLPEGPNQARDANAAAEFTDNLANAIGEVKERHIGDHEHLHTNHSHNHNHDNQST